MLSIIAATACGETDKDNPASGGSPSGGGSTGTGGSGAFGGRLGDECITDLGAKSDYVFDCSDLDWNVSLPFACATTSCGLIFDVHGFSMSGLMEDHNDNLVELGEKHGYIVVQPNADPAPPESSWLANEDDGKVFDF